MNKIEIGEEVPKEAREFKFKTKEEERFHKTFQEMFGHLIDPGIVIEFYDNDREKLLTDIQKQGKFNIEDKERLGVLLDEELNWIKQKGEKIPAMTKEEKEALRERQGIIFERKASKSEWLRKKRIKEALEQKELESK